MWTTRWITPFFLIQNVFLQRVVFVEKSSILMQNSTFCDNIFGNLSPLFTLMKIIKIAMKT